MELGSTPVLISFRPVAAPTRYLAACTNKSRALKEDFDVRCVQEKSNDTYFIIQQVKEKVYVIKSAAKPNHYLFCSNDDTRKHEDDFDVRTHSFQEARNNWIIESHGWSVFTIRSETNPNHFLFVATDKSNKLDKDFDVRTQNKENQNNHWYLVTNPTFTTPYPLKHEPLIVTFNPAHLPQHSLTIGDTHQSFTDDFSVNVQQNNNQHSKFILDRVTGDAFAIRSFQYPSFYLYVDNKKNLINSTITMSDFTQSKISETYGQLNKQNLIIGQYDHQPTLINTCLQSRTNQKQFKLSNQSPSIPRRQKSMDY